MPYFILMVDNLAFCALEDHCDDLDPLIRWPWLDPYWGIVEDHIEGVELRYPRAREAEMVVQAEPDFLARWNFEGDIIKGGYPDGRMFIDRKGEISHVTFKRLTHLSGIVAHDLFAQSLPNRVEDLDQALNERFEEFITSRLFDEIGPRVYDLDPSRFGDAIQEALRGFDLLAADYPDVDACMTRVLEILAADPFR
jgi:hypothetical protein